MRDIKQIIWGDLHYSVQSARIKTTDKIIGIKNELGSGLDSLIDAYISGTDYNTKNPLISYAKQILEGYDSCIERVKVELKEKLGERNLEKFCQEVIDKEKEKLHESLKS